MVQASGWPGSGRDTASCRRAGRRLVEEQPGEGLGDRDGRVAEPEADLAVLAATASPSVSRRTRDSGRPCSSIKLAAARSSSFVPSPVARRRSRAGQALQGCRSSPSSWPGRFVPAGPQRQQGRQAGHRGCGVTREAAGESAGPGPPKTPATGIPASNAARIKLVRVRPAAGRPAKPKAVARRKVSASPIDPVPDFLPVAGGAIIVALMPRPAARRARIEPLSAIGLPPAMVRCPGLHHRARPAPRIPPSRPAQQDRRPSIHDQLTGNRLVSGRAAVSPAPAGY